MHEHHNRPMIAAGVLLGVGLGGFLDGILFHQILQLHSMLSNRLPRTSIVNLEVNMFWDGLFHAFTWIMTLAGVVLLWHAGAQRRSPWKARAFVGALLFGWGLFNTVEGVINHLILQLHHVVENSASNLTWDLAFLVFGISLMIAGLALIRSGQKVLRLSERIA